jgi:hypothetical protein
MTDREHIDRFLNSWLCALEAEFGDDSELVLYKIVIAMVARILTYFDPEKVCEHLNAQFVLTNVPYRLTRIS